MEVFNFYIDRKCSVWFRERYEIEASSKSDAILLFKKKYEEGNTDSEFINQDMLDDTIEETNIFEILDQDYNKI